MSLIDRHIQILKLLYRYRFLNRPQIQYLIAHKSFSRLSIWLNQLTRHSYIRRYYTKSVHSQAAVYSLGTKGRKALIKTQDPAINKKSLDRVWREHLLSFQTRKHLMLVADTSIAVSALAETKKAQLTFYTKIDLQGLKHLILPLPDAYFAISEQSGLTNRYFLEIIDDFPAREKLIKLVWNYFSYYQKRYWQTHAHKPFPHIILITPDARTSKMLYRLIQYKLKTEPRLTFLLLKRQDVLMLGIKTNLFTVVKKASNRRTQGPAARISY
jgi:hypothetical protein